MIRRLAYVSRPRPDLPAAEISRIVVRSRLNNERHKIAGVLVYTGTHFAQLIEGPPVDVEALWRRIKRDDRHLDVVLLLHENAVSPWFRDWRMGYLPESALSRHIDAWCARGRALDARSRWDLRQLLAAADSL